MIASSKTIYKGLQFVVRVSTWKATTGKATWIFRFSCRIGGKGEIRRMKVQLQLLALLTFAVVVINGKNEPGSEPKSDTGPEPKSDNGNNHGRFCPASFLPVVVNASRPDVTGPLTVGSVVNYTCNDGYIPAPGSNMNYTCDFTCGGIGRWTGNPACCIQQSRSCPVSLLPEVANATHPGLTGSLTGSLAVGSMVTYACNRGFDPAPESNMTLTCNEAGDWTGNPTCLILTLSCPPNASCTNAVTTSDGVMWRLCDGDGPGLCNTSKGRIEVNFNSEWGTICDDYFSWSNLNVTCRMFGFSGSNDVSRGSAYFGQGVGRILMDDVNCLGYETALTECHYKILDNCDHAEDQGVECV